MQTLGEQLQQYAAAMADPTRAMILIELSRAKELTATQLAQRLDLTANNVYHHMRVLRRCGVVSPPRPVPGPSYVEKYYSIKPNILAALQMDPEWFDEALSTMTAEDRKALLVSMCVTMAHLLLRAAQRYQSMEAAELDTLAREQQLSLVSINEVSRAHLKARLTALREILVQEQDQFPQEDPGSTDVILMAGLPSLWEEHQ